MRLLAVENYVVHAVDEHAVALRHGSVHQVAEALLLRAGRQSEHLDFPRRRRVGRSEHRGRLVKGLGQAIGGLGLGGVLSEEHLDDVGPGQPGTDEHFGLLLHRFFQVAQQVRRRHANVDQGRELLLNHRLDLLVQLLEVFGRHIVEDAFDGVAHAIAASRQQEGARAPLGIAAAPPTGIFEVPQQLCQALPAEADFAELVGELAAQGHVCLVDALQHEVLVAPLGVELQSLAEFLDERRHPAASARILAQHGQSRVDAAVGLGGSFTQLLTERLVVFQGVLDGGDELADRFLGAGQAKFGLLDQGDRKLSDAVTPFLERRVAGLTEGVGHHAVAPGDGGFVGAADQLFQPLQSVEDRRRVRLRRPPAFGDQRLSQTVEGGFRRLAHDALALGPLVGDPILHRVAKGAGVLGDPALHQPLAQVPPRAMQQQAARPGEAIDAERLAGQASRWSPHGSERRPIGVGGPAQGRGQVTGEVFRGQAGVGVRGSAVSFYRQRQQHRPREGRLAVADRAFLLVVAGRKDHVGSAEVIQLGQGRIRVAQCQRACGSRGTVDRRQEEQAEHLRPVVTQIAEQVPNGVSQVDEHAAAGAARQTGDDVDARLVGA